jgi:hypothetical protein
VIKGIFAMCQSTKHDLNVAKARNKTLLNNKGNLHQKLNLDELFEEFKEEELSSQVADSFTFINLDDITDFGMGEPGSSSHAPCNEDDDGEEYDEEATKDDDE